MDIREVNLGVIEEFRSNGGACTGWLQGADVLLLTMRGAKSGRELCSPLAYSTDGGDLVVAASNGGAPANPKWYHNLVADPAVTVEVGTEVWHGTAQLVEPESERKRLFDAHAGQMDNFVEYERTAGAAGRLIPVFRLVRNRDG